MQIYVYEARNSEGIAISGLLQAETRDVAVAILRRKGYFLLNVDRQNRLVAKLGENAGLVGRVRLSDLTVFTRQFATLLNAGMQLSIALKTLIRQTENKNLAAVIEQLHNDIEQSSSLSAAMAKHPRVFSKVYTAVVAAAEESGTLGTTLESLAKHLKTIAATNARVKTALAYPAFLLVVCIGIVAVLLGFVVPKFIELFVNANQKLPIPTLILLGFTAFLKRFWWVIAIIFAGVFVTISAAMKQEKTRLLADAMLLKAPVFGMLNRKLQLAQFARTFGSLLSGGVKIVYAMNTAVATTTNMVFARQIRDVAEKIIQGMPLAAAMREGDYFTEMMINMVAVGEETARLPQMLMEIADMYDQESETAINSMTAMLGPVLIVFLGLMIGFVVLAILLPIFQTSSMMG